jgi:hypothetical protein
MIKLKDIIKEIDNSTDISTSKMEEQYAVEYYMKHILPKDVMQYNSSINNQVPTGVGAKHTTTEEVIRNLRKTQHFKTDGVFQDKIVYKSKIGVGTWGDIVFEMGIYKRGNKLIIKHQYPFMNFIFHTELKENKIYCRLSKIQEQEGLQYIQKFLIKKAVDAFNKFCIGYNITEEEVKKKLRKIVDYRPPDDIEGQRYVCDIVAYGSTIDRFKDNYYPDGLQFRFDISIDGEGKLLTAYTTPITSIKAWFNVHNSQVPKSLTENIENRMTKMDKQYSYDYMIRHIIPKILEDTYYRHIKKTPRMYPEGKYPRNITPQDIIKNLKKIREDFDRVEYESAINDRISFDFIIVKEHQLVWSPHMICGVRGPLDLDRKWYDIKYTPSVIKENVNSKFPISKMEEQIAVEFIRRNLIPYIVETYNDTCRGYTHQPEANISDVNKTLRKIKHGQSPYGKDEIIYRILIDMGIRKEPYEFRIYKNYEGKLFVGNRGHGTDHRVKI